MEQKQQAQSRLNALRKFIPTAQDAEIVKEMIADGLSNEQILHALGHVTGTPKGGTLPNGHEYSNVQTTEQQEKDAQGAELQPGQAVGDVEDSEEGDSGDDMLTHVAGLLSHVAKNKSKNSVKSGPSGTNRR